MSTGGKALEAFIAQVEGLATLNFDVAKKASPAVDAAIKSTAAKGRTPSGQQWPDKTAPGGHEEEGGPALQGAASAITTTARGKQIIVSVAPPYAYHNHGAGGSSQTKHAKAARAKTEARHAESGTKSKFHAPKRQIIPEQGEMPEPVRAAVEEAAREVFGKTMGGESVR